MMKFKPNQTRTYDGEGFKKRAACLCFKNDREDEVKVQMWFNNVDYCTTTIAYTHVRNRYIETCKVTFL